MRIAIDTGGTFTDCVALVDGQLKVLKLRSTPHDPGAAVMQGVKQLDSAQRAASAVQLCHGTTVGTNAMLERKGARVAFVTTQGFEDTISIGRQTRPKLYAWSSEPNLCLVPERLRFGVPERVTADGETLRSPTDAELAELVKQVRSSGAEAIAISLLFAFLNPANERRVEQALLTLGLPVSTGHRILPEFREYERATTLVVNAYLAPKMQGYLLGLQRSIGDDHSGTVHVMQSSGGIVGAQLAAKEPVRTVLSGPAGGVMGAWAMAQAAGIDRILGFDMGGTSTDVFLADAQNGGPSLTTESTVAGVPVNIPMLDIHTAGAGGGSLARFDAGGLLRVGPESAAADPGPVCFGHGTEPTVTDANLLLGRLDAEQFMNGSVKLDLERVRICFEAQRGTIPSAELFAEGILRVVETQMERAIRLISIERGHDPRDFTLVAFGGGGPLHACAVARALSIPKVMIPAMPGALSAVGILLADSVRDYSRTVMLPQSQLQTLHTNFAALQALSDEELGGQQYLIERSVDLRYQGQGYELNVPYSAETADNFHTMHAQRYGFANRERVLEIVNIRLRVRVLTEPYAPARGTSRAGDGSAASRCTQRVFFNGDWQEAKVYDRNRLHPGDHICGPALIAEYTSVTVLPPHASLQVDELSNLMIEVEAIQ